MQLNTHNKTWATGRFLLSGCEPVAFRIISFSFRGCGSVFFFCCCFLLLAGASRLTDWRRNSSQAWQTGFRAISPVSIGNHPLTRIATSEARILFEMLAGFVDFGNLRCRTIPNQVENSNTIVYLFDRIQWPKALRNFFPIFFQK